MLHFLSANRSIFDARNYREIAMYFLKYMPASCFVTYILLQQLHGRLAPAATFAVAAAMVVSGVELRAAVRRRRAGNDR